MMNNRSRLILGTAQLGGKYGIANVHGDPSLTESYELIRYAVSSGIAYLDTAPGYGNSERIIGDCLGNFSLNSRPNIVTKLPSVQRLGFKTQEERRSFVYSSIRSSLDKLQLSALDTCLLHDPLDMSYQNGEIIHMLKELQRKQLIRKIGVSVYDPQDIEVFVSIDGLDSIQLPINLFDQRLIRNGMLNKLADKGTAVFVRSVYLQGLLLMDPERLPDTLKQARKPLELLIKYSRQTGISIQELACLFVGDLPGVSGIVIGCETVEQLKENLRMMALPPLNHKWITELSDLFTDISTQIIDPRMWK